MKRRDVLQMLTFSLGALASHKGSAQPHVPVVAILGSGVAAETKPQIELFISGLTRQGLRPGKDVVIAYRWAEGNFGRLGQLAKELESLKPAVYFASGGSPSASALKSLTSNTPVLFSTGEDPVALGLLSDVQRPEGNITGAAFHSLSLGAKRLEIIAEALGSIEVAALVDPSSSTGSAEIKDLPFAARQLGINLLIHEVTNDTQLQQSFSHMRDKRPNALLVGGSVFLATRRTQIINKAMQERIPVIASLDAFAELGGLISYGGSRDEAYTKMGEYAAQIIAGARVADLPVWFTRDYELIINVRTANALGLSIPAALLARATRIIN